jgi:hypothetical protein
MHFHKSFQRGSGHARYRRASSLPIVPELLQVIDSSCFDRRHRPWLEFQVPRGDWSWSYPLVRSVDRPPRIKLGWIWFQDRLMVLDADMVTNPAKLPFGPGD